MDLTSLAGIRDVCKSIFADKGNGHESTQLVSDSLWDYFINDGDDEACRQGRLIVDSQTSSICSATVTVSDPWVSYHAKILDVIEVVLDSTDLDLKRIGLSEMNVYSTGDDYGQKRSSKWKTDTGTPRVFVPNMDVSAIRLAPIPVVADSVWMTVIRLPLSAMTEETHAPETPAKYAKAILHWALHQAHLKDSTDTYNAEQSALHLSIFNRIIAEGRHETGKLMRAPQRMRYGGI